MSEPFERAERSCFNLTHYAMLLPESHAVFSMPPGCSRILRLSAIEEGISHRFTMFNLEQVDVIRGDVESIIIENTLATLERLTALGRRPKILMVFVSCIDGFIGTDHEYVLDELRAAAPDVIFMDLAVDPINRDITPPLARLHRTVAALFEKSGDEPAVLWLGHYLPPAGDAPLRQKLEAAGLSSRHLSDCETLEELRRLGSCRAVIAATKMAVPAAKELKARLGVPYYNLTDPTDPDSLREEALLAL